MGKKLSNRRFSQTYPLKTQLNTIRELAVELSSGNVLIQENRNFTSLNKCYVNLKSTLPKLKWLFQNYLFSTMLGMVEGYIKSFYYQRKPVPVLTLPNGSTDIEPSLKRWSPEDIVNHDQMRSRILSVERAMAGFLGPDTAQL